MRNAINNNPIVQMAVLAVLGLLVAVMFLSGGGGSSTTEDTAATDTASPETAAAATPTADPATSGTPVAPETAAVPPSAPPAAGAPFEASKGLPAELVSAYESGDVVVLLVMQKKGIEDKSLHEDVQSLEGDGGTSVFVTDVKDISKYSRIAEGVNLDRVPAIIVLHPLKGGVPKGESAPLPTASVSYGYRGPESVRQTVKDVRYNGKQLAYDPG